MPDSSRDIVPLTADTGLVRAQHLSEKLREYIDAAKAPSTVRAYASSWRVFSAWCRSTGLDALPAAPSTVAAYLADRAGQVRPATLNKELAALSQAHQAMGLSSPTLDVAVRTVMKGIRRRHGTAPRQKKPLLTGDIVNMLHGLGDGLRARRDRCLVLLGFAGALRRSELVALEVRDLQWHTDGLVLHLRSTKTDQEGTGRKIGITVGSSGSCPVTATRCWLTATGIDDGPLLRAIDRHGNVSPQAMHPESVCRTVQRLVTRIGHSPAGYGAHSLRAGFVTSAVGHLTEAEIALTTGHRSVAVLRGYVRRANVLTGDYVRRIGL